MSAKHKRVQMTKARLLPLQATHVKALCLKHHLALDSVRRGHGDMNRLAQITHAVYLAALLQSTLDPESSPQPFTDAELAVDRCIERAHTGQGVTFPTEDLDLLQRVLLIHDSQLSSITLHTYVEALHQLQTANFAAKKLEDQSEKRA